MNILDQLADYAKLRVEEAKKSVGLSAIRKLAQSTPRGSFEFENALKKDGISFICECKKASPSKGVIAEKYDYLQIATDYEKAGGDCISVLTEPKWFLGSNEHLNDITCAVTIPCIRKDFTVDEYMIYEARLLGASAVLLICAILDDSKIKEYINICDTLGMSALVEAHDIQEVERALNCGARVVGVNNRNLKDFSVDTANSIKLRKYIPSDVLFVAESGVKTREDVIRMQDAGADALLVGETLMRAQDKIDMLDRLRGIRQ